MGQVRTQGKEKTQVLTLVGPSPKTEASTKQDLEMAAYFHWLGRGCPSDDALTDWIEVEKKWGGESVSNKMDVQA